MTTTTTTHCADAQGSLQATRRMIDAPTRMFHWMLAICFVGAYATSEGERWRLVHITLGYTMIGLVGFRLVWLLLGPKPARWTAWAARFRALLGSIRSAKVGQFRWSALQVGFNSLAVVALVLTAVVATASGYVLDQEWLGDWFEEVHEFAGNALLGFVLVHLALVLLGAFIQSANPLTLMLTGKAPGKGPDLITRNRVWLAVLMLVAVMGFGWMQWRNAPEQLPVTEMLTAPSHHGSGDHDDDD